MEGYGKLGILAVALFGGGYAVTGESDFEVTVARPQAEVYRAFSGARTFTSGFRDSGIATVSVRTERPSPDEIVYWSGEEGADDAMRIGLTFAPDGPGRTTVTAAIDVPAVESRIEGERKVLSEAKVEDAFEERIAEIGRRLNQGQDVDGAVAEFTNLLDLVALATKPEQLEKLTNR